MIIKFNLFSGGFAFVGKYYIVFNMAYTTFKLKWYQ